MNDTMVFVETEADQEFTAYYNTPFSWWTTAGYIIFLMFSLLFFGTLRRLRGDILVWEKELNKKENHTLTMLNLLGLDDLQKN